MEEENLECLCKLFTTVGHKLESNLSDLEQRSKTNEQEKKWSPEPKWMHNVFAKLKKLSQDKKLTSRIRFALLVGHQKINQKSLIFNSYFVVLLSFASFFSGRTLLNCVKTTGFPEEKLMPQKQLMRFGEMRTKKKWMKRGN